MGIRTSGYFCNRELLLLFKEELEKKDKNTYEKMNESNHWDRNELFDMIYHACIFLDYTKIKKAYSTLLSNNWIADMTIDDTVIYTCVSNNDIVSCFCWIFNYHNNDFNKIRPAIGATLNAFKKSHYLERIYETFLNYLKTIWLPIEANSDSTDISEAICLLLHRLRDYEHINAFITAYGKTLKVTPLSTLWWVQDVFSSKYSNQMINTPGGIEKLLSEIGERWDYLVESCKTNPEILKQTGRWAFILRWFIKYRENSVVRKTGKFIIANSIFRNKHIDEIKEILTVDIDFPFVHMYIDKIAMYMSPSKIERFFHISEHKSSDATWCLTCADHMNDANEGVVLYGYLSSLGVDYFENNVRNFGVGFNNERSSVFLGSFSMSFNNPYLNVI
jgi:hypothetical protein